MAPPLLDSTHAPASGARHGEREEKDDEPRESRDRDPTETNERNQENERRDLIGSATSEKAVQSLLLGDRRT